MSTQTASTATTLRLAVDVGDSESGWIELTPAAPGEVERFTAPTLHDAAVRTARSTRASFVDLDVFLADSVPAAFDGLARNRPGWTPGARGDSLVHAGTPSTLAGLLWDIWAARVADGVTLRGDDPHRLTHRVVAEILPLLAARGLVVQTRSSAAVA